MAWRKRYPVWESGEPTLSHLSHACCTLLWQRYLGSLQSLAHRKYNNAMALCRPSASSYSA